MSYYLYEVDQHYNAKKTRQSKQGIIHVGAHLGIDPGPLVPKSDTLTTRLRGQVVRARNNRTYWTDNPSIGHIRFSKQGKKGKFCTLFVLSPDLFICIWYLDNQI